MSIFSLYYLQHPGDHDGIAPLGLKTVADAHTPPPPRTEDVCYQVGHWFLFPFAMPEVEDHIFGSEQLGPLLWFTGLPKRSLSLRTFSLL